MSLIFGVNVVGELVAHAPHVIRTVIHRPDSGPQVDAVVAAARAAGVSVREGDDRQLRERSGSRGGSAIAAEVVIPTPPDLETFGSAAATPPLLIALDQVSDPHNLGAILRSAAAFGADAIIVPKRGGAPLNDAALRASAGAAALIPVIRVTNLSRTIRSLGAAGVWSVVADAAGEATLSTVDLTLPTVIVLGAEGRGVRPGVAAACEVSLRLPMVGPIGSLNVSVTAGIILAHAARVRAGH